MLLTYYSHCLFHSILFQQSLVIGIIVIDKDKLSKLVGITYFILGVILILNGFFSLKKLEYLAIIGVVIVLLEVCYVNFKLVR